MSELKNHQPSMTIDEQISNLREKGMIIKNEDYAKSLLNDASYFRLIKAYSLGLKEENGNYHENVRFEDVVSLYSFNSNFRQQVFLQIEKVEINMRCRLSNYFCDKYGVLGYEDLNNFVSAVHHDELLDDIQREVSRNKKAPFVKNFLNNYMDGKIPLYALVELFSFGTLSKFYKNMKNEDKKAVATTFDAGYTYFESWIESLAYVRNVCAHYGRLYNAKLPKTPKLYKHYTKKGVNNFSIFSILLTLKHLLPNDRHWNDFVQTVELLIEKYPSVDLRLIGFPEEWADFLKR